MINYQFQIFVPSLEETLFFREITMRDWININKSILGNDQQEIINCFEQIILKSCNLKNLLLTLYDKIIILLSIRAFSIGNFSDLNITDQSNNEQFKYTLEINDLLNSLKKIPIKSKQIFKIKELSIQYGVPLNPILNNSNIIHCVDYIHCIYDKDEVILDNINNKKEIREIINELDTNLVSSITNYAVELNKIFNSNPLYIIKNPSSEKIVIQKYMSFDFELYDLIKLLYTENLHMLYKSIYDFNKILNIPPIYVESLPPVEKELLWGYYLKEQKDAELSKSLKGQNTFTA